ncbi:hypothetical protein J3R82DRAFT_9053 [Butyriboletus roseoflavus]|nr:hypothetical protein J3R82DRAFT_9053 [Butyriboletus roseoflavus]
MTAIHLNIKPTHCHKSIEEVAQTFDIPDLYAALSHYVRYEARRIAHSHIRFYTFSGQRYSPSNTDLSFTELQIWFKAHLQQRLYYYLDENAVTFTVNTHPPNQKWKYGQYDATVPQVDKLS